MTLVDFLARAADAIPAMEPDTLEPYSSAAEAAAEAQQHAEECSQ